MLLTCMHVLGEGASGTRFHWQIWRRRGAPSATAIKFMPAVFGPLVPLDSLAKTGRANSRWSQLLRRRPIRLNRANHFEVILFFCELTASLPIELAASTQAQQPARKRSKASSSSTWPLPAPSTAPMPPLRALGGQQRDRDCTAQWGRAHESHSENAHYPAVAHCASGSFPPGGSGMWSVL